MKHTTLLTAAALFLGVAGLQAQNDATTKPVGFVTHTLKAGQFNLVGLTLHNPVSVSGAFETVSGNTLTDTNIDFSTALTAGKTYILEIIENPNDPTYEGAIQEITSWSGNSITTPDDLSAGLDSQTTYQLRETSTLESVFGTASSQLTSGFSVTTADVVWVPTGPGQFKRCYIKRPTNVWWDADLNVALPNYSLNYTDALFIEKKGSDTNLTITGSVKTLKTIALMQAGFTPISLVFPVGTTLLNSGLESSVASGFSSTSADILWIPDGAGAYTRYYVKRPANNWTRINANGSETTVTAGEDFDMPTGFFVERKSTAANLLITPPASYNNL